MTFSLANRFLAGGACGKVISSTLKDLKEGRLHSKHFNKDRGRRCIAGAVSISAVPTMAVEGTRLHSQENSVVMAGQS
jgi:hypothetical protein